MLHSTNCTAAQDLKTCSEFSQRRNEAMVREERDREQGETYGESAICAVLGDVSI